MGAAEGVEDYLRRQRARLQAVRIAVNVSPLQLGNRGFAKEIEKVIRVDRLAAGGWYLKLPKKLIMAYVKHGVSSLQKLRSMGVTIAIDDYYVNLQGMGEIDNHGH